MTVIVWFRPSCISCIFRIFYSLIVSVFFLLFCCFMVASSMGLSANREINMMMIMMMMMVVVMVMMMMMLVRCSARGTASDNSSDRCQRRAAGVS